MSEWWTYTLQDFLMFSPRTYFRMFELYNAEIWPAQIAALLLGLAVLILSRRPTPAAGRVVSAAMATCWLWTAIAFHIHRYAEIFSAGIYVGAAFALEAALWLGQGVLGGRIIPADKPSFARRAGFAMMLFALILQPLVGPALGRPWRQIQLFGVTPDPTAVATLGVLLLAQGRPRWELAAIPLLWCGISAATLAAMKAAEAWFLIAVVVAASALMVWKTLRRRRSPANSAEDIAPAAAR